MGYERAWATSFDNAYFFTSALDFTRYELWSLKAMLCGQLGGLTLGLWSVYSSSDSSTAGNADGPGVDRWLSTYDGTKIVRGAGGAAKSWVVLKSPTSLTPLGVSFYLTIAFDGASDSTASLYLAKAVPTGGTTTARPTAADEWLVGLATSSWNVGTITSGYISMNMWLSSTGDFVWTPVRLNRGTPARVAELCVATVNPVGCSSMDRYPLWSYKFFTNGTGTWGFSMPQLVTTSIATQPTRRSDGMLAGLTLTLPTANAGHLLSGTSGIAPAYADMLTGNHLALPMWVVVYTIATAGWHVRGRLPDILCAPNGSSGSPVPPGTAFRENGAVKWVAQGNLWLPSSSVPALG